MKYTIFGVDQRTALEQGLKVNECIILSWAKGIFGQSFAFSFEENGHAFYWLKVDQLMEDYPVLQIKKDSVLKKIKKLSDDGYFIKVSKTLPNGNFGYYSPTPKFDNLFKNSHKNKDQYQEKTDSKIHPQKNAGDKIHPQKNAGGMEKNAGGMEKNACIPSNNNLQVNTPPPEPRDFFPSSLKNKEEEEIFRWLKKTLNMCSENDILDIISRHGKTGVESIYRQFEKDHNAGTVRTIGAFYTRLMKLNVGETGSRLFLKKNLTKPKNDFSNYVAESKSQAVDGEEMSNILKNIPFLKDNKSE